MLNPQLCNVTKSKVPSLLAAPFLTGGENVRAPARRMPACFRKRHLGHKAAVRAEAAATAVVTTVEPQAETQRLFVVSAVLVAHKRNSGTAAGRADLPAQRLLVELVMSTQQIGGSHAFYVDMIREEGDAIIYSGMSAPVYLLGEVGAVQVKNEHDNEMYLGSVSLDGLPQGEVEITCNSWLHSHLNSPEKRIFFTNQSYLPSQTPAGLREYREVELKALRGDGEGQRESFERIYDYDTYNDLGDPNVHLDLLRPVLGGTSHPYPRRCRTGRPPTLADPLSESRVFENYVPRDEKFSDVKQVSFSSNVVYAVLSAVLPTLEGALEDPTAPFPYFTVIDSLYDERVKIPSDTPRLTLKDVLPDLVKIIRNPEQETPLRFDTPDIFFSDRFGWLKDEEFARQTLSGINPCCIQLVKEWPLRSELDPEIYGPPESAITTELIESQIGMFMTVEEAITQEKLFMVDYHDTFLPFVNRVRALGDDNTMYGSRTLFFLMPDGTLKPIAIELTRPPSDDKPQWREVYTPTGGSTGGSTGAWLWKFAKAHAVANDSAYHQLISHWLRTHACSEPYAIAMHRQLSEMHPIHRLLRPHFRYTLEINAIGRVTLISAGGTTETVFNAGKYAMEMSSEIYKQWRFDTESLPVELINRGMAVKDESAPHGLRLTVQDYPYANDGLLIWDSIKEWVSEYVNHYYPSSDLITSDSELQAWWSEVRTRGHEDKKNEPWWPKLENSDDLIGILTTIIWVASAHHAAVNFGQYGYAGYSPNRPTIARRKMPTEDPTEEEWRFFKEKPEAALLQSFPSMIQATRVMTVMYVLSTHSPDEEYIGEKPEAAWAANPTINAAFERFSERVKGIERTVEVRNGNEELKNRCGAGVVPYELLKPTSEPGVTSMGVPNSISI